MQPAHIENLWYKVISEEKRNRSSLADAAVLKIEWVDMRSRENMIKFQYGDAANKLQANKIC